MAEGNSGSGSPNGATGTQGPSGAPSGSPTQGTTPKARLNLNTGPEKAANTNVETAANETPRDEYGRFKATLKVDGAEESIDLSREQLIERLQRQRAYERKEKTYRDGLAEVEKVKRALSHLHQSPEEVLEGLGIDLDSIAEARLQRKAQLQALSPAELEALRAKAEVERMRAQLEQVHQERQTAQEKAMAEAVWRESEPRMIKAMEAAGLPRTGEAIRLFARIGRDALDEGIELSEARIAEEVAARLGEPIEQHWRQAPVEQLIAKLGPEAIAAIIKHQVAQARAKRGQQPAAKAAVQNGAKNGAHNHDNGYITEAEYRKRNGL